MNMVLEKKNSTINDAVTQFVSDTSLACDDKHMKDCWPRISIMRWWVPYSPWAIFVPKMCSGSLSHKMRT